MMHIRNNNKKELTSETLSQVRKVYKLWLLRMVLTSEQRRNTPTDERKDLLVAASKKLKLTDKRRDKIAARIEDAGLARCQRAVYALSQSDFHLGENDRGWTADVEWLFKNYEKIEEWANKYTGKEQ